MIPARPSLVLVGSVCALLATGARLHGAKSPILYASVGEALTQYDADVDAATLTPRSTVTLPGYVQEAWRHPSTPVLYVAWSNGGPLYAAPSGGAPPAATRSGVTAFAIDPATGSLRAIGEPTTLRARPIYVTCDITGSHLLVAYNNPSGVSVHQIRADGTIGSEVAQPQTLDTGIYAHQIRVSPTNAAVIVATRGNEPANGRAEDPGAVKAFRYRDGVLSNLQSVAPNRGLGFRSRHIDFHPTRPWIFLTLESQNMLQVYRRRDDESLDPAPLFAASTLAIPEKPESPGQAASSIHVHPNGRFVYVANRASGRGENSIAVFSIDQQSGRPARIQNVDTRGVQPRTFAIDPGGRLLVVGNQTSMPAAPANLAVFRIGANGQLAFVRTYDVHAADKPLLWVGIIEI